MQGREVVIVEAVRTPVGRGHPEKGQYHDVHPNALLGAVFTEVIARSGIDAEAVEDVIAGCVLAYGEQSVNIGRNAWLQAGLPFETPATTIDRQCGSAQQAVNFGAALVASGVHDVVIGGGVEHMGHVPMSSIAAIAEQYGQFYPPELLERYDLIPQGLSAELIAETWEISREECDAFALRSQQRAAQATARGPLRPGDRPDRGRTGRPITTDQGIRPGTSLEGLAELKPAFKPDGRHTAGNSSQVSDGAAAVLLASRETADALGLRRPGAGRRPPHGRGRSRDDADRARSPPRRRSSSGTGSRSTTSTSSRSTRPSRRSCWRGSASTGPTWSGSTSTAAPSRSVIRSARPAPA